LKKSTGPTYQPQPHSRAAGEQIAVELITNTTKRIGRKAASAIHNYQIKRPKRRVVVSTV
jgi:hypothetical protein